MNKKFFFAFFIVGFSSFAQISTPAPSPSTVVSQKVGLADVAISYSRPSMKGRKIFGENVPFGSIWRTGANQVSTIKFDDEMLINGSKIAAGSYALFTIPNHKEWTIILNKDDKQWGASNYNAELDVLRFKLPSEILPLMIENFTIAFADFTPTTSNIVIAWEKTAVKFKIEHQVEARIMAEIASKTAAENASIDTFFDAADYYYEKNYDLPKAYEWATKVVASQQEYWTFQLKARIGAKMGNCKTAIEDAEKSMELAKKAGDIAYIKKNEKVFADCKK